MTRFASGSHAGVPQQAGVIAVRRDGNGFEVCLVRRKASRRWGIPKGMVDRGDTHEETALNEAWEEAGLKGRLIGEALGTFEYKKWDRDFVVAVYLMDVTEASDDYEEAHFRDRTWWSLTEAATKLGDITPSCRCWRACEPDWGHVGRGLPRGGTGNPGGRVIMNNVPGRFERSPAGRRVRVGRGGRQRRIQGADETRRRRSCI